MIIQSFLYKIIQITVIFILISVVAAGQYQTKRIESEEEIKNFLRFHSNKIPPVKTMKSINIDELLKEDESERDQGLPPRFGRAFDVDLNIDNSGVWDEFSLGRIWKLQIESPGAFSINLNFDELYLPDGAELYLYNREKTMISGPITFNNNRKNGRLATDLIEGSSIILELFEPSNHVGESKIHINKVIHGYKDLFNKAGFGDSGNCNNDINCPVGNGWENESDAVAMIIVNNNRICSGALLNNGCQDYTPSFLSAFHCLDRDGSGALSTAEIDEVENDWVFRFQYKSPSCDGPDDSNFYWYTGTNFRAAWERSDFLLVELEERPHGSTGIKLAGWNRGTGVANSTVGIHHPSGDVMKISFDDQSPQSDGYLGGPGSDHWRVDWDDGTTEGGSSGSPLFDHNQRIIGQLHGGYASCPGTDERDWYGRFFSSWSGGDQDGNGTIDGDEQLSVWLTNDPNDMATSTTGIPWIQRYQDTYILCGNTSGIPFYLNNAPSSITHNVNWNVSANLTITQSQQHVAYVERNGTQSGMGTISATVTNNDTQLCPQKMLNFLFRYMQVHFKQVTWL